MNAKDETGKLRSNAHGEPLASLPAIARSAEADVNLVLSSTALDAARVLQERFGTPYVVGLPMGDAACTRVADLLKEAALTGESKILWEAGSAAETAKDSRTLIVGEPVYAASLRWVLEQGATCALAGPAVGPASDVQVLCPLEDPCGCLRDTDRQSWREPVRRARRELLRPHVPRQDSGVPRAGRHPLNAPIDSVGIFRYAVANNLNDACCHRVAGNTSFPFPLGLRRGWR